MNEHVVVQTTGLRRDFAVPTGILTAVNDATFTAHAGEILVIKGRSGAGKTTLLNLVAGTDLPTAGSVERPDDVSYVMQEFGLIDVLTAHENVGLPLRIRGVEVAEREQRTFAALESVGLAKHGHQRPTQMSGGQRQRVAIARALVTESALLIADEPTGQLDSLSAKNVMDILVELAHKSNVAVVVTTHDPILVERADRVLVMHNGHLSESHQEAH